VKKRQALIAILIAIVALSHASAGPPQAGQPLAARVDAVPNRYLAFGDSITYGGYVDAPYPALLENKLDIRVADSEVINSGNPGEKTYGGSERITGEVSEHQPRYVLILEGTNDVTDENPPSEVYDHLKVMIDNARETAGVEGVRVMIATIIPRLDYLNDATYKMNQEAVIPAALEKQVPLCDLWQAFYEYGPWPILYADDKHPNQMGLKLIADTFYDCLLATYPEVEEETTPPTTWIESLPASIECGEEAPVSWNGSDNLNWVVDYDVQAQVGDGKWTDWLLATQETSGSYAAEGWYGDAWGFRVRGRDLLGNEGAYGDAAYTLIADSVAPYEAHVDPLQPIEVVPFAVSWWGSDACADVIAYDVQYRVGSDGAWQDWLSATPDQSGSFDPPAPQYGQTYYFQVRAWDAADNRGTWSGAEAQTVVAQFSLSGSVYNVRHQPVAAAEVKIVPPPLQTAPWPAGFLAYLATGGDSTISARRDDLYGTLPAMHREVNASLSGLALILPPQDEAVIDGGFEEGNLNAWQTGGTAMLTLATEAHTGLGAVRLGVVGDDSYLSQAIIPALSPSEPTLSFLVRLGEGSPASELEIRLTNSGVLSPTLTYTVAIEDEEWVHVWYDLTGLVGEPLTLTLAVVDNPAVLVDEISLGSAIRGGTLIHLSVVFRSR